MRLKLCSSAVNKDIMSTDFWFFLLLWEAVTDAAAASAASREKQPIFDPGACFLMMMMMAVIDEGCVQGVLRVEEGERKKRGRRERRMSATWSITAKSPRSWRFWRGSNAARDCIKSKITIGRSKILLALQCWCLLWAKINLKFSVFHWGLQWSKTSCKRQKS